MLHQRQNSSQCDGLPLAKRRKAQLACSYCRERKTRCDGKLPACSPCQKRGQSQYCAYEESTLKTQRHVARLEQKIKELERSNTQLSASLKAHNTSENDAPAVHISSSTNFEHDSVSRPMSDSNRSAEHEGPYVGDNPAIDGLATVSPLVHTAESTASYGGSSTIAFLRNLLVMVDERSPHASLTRPEHSTTRTRGRMTEGRADDVDHSAVVLPSRRMADSFVDAFFDIVHPLYPIIYRPTFMSSYHNLWISSASEDRGDAIELPDTALFWSVANIVFALGCQFSSLVDPPKRASLAAEFYQRSRSLFTTDVLDTASIEGVQLLLLTSVYLQSTDLASRCWNVLGLAIRASQALGLHLEQRHASCTSQLDRELGRRIWYNCVILDKLQSMTFGRPTMLTTSEVRPPQLIDDEYLLISGESVQPPKHQSQLAFFTVSISLFEILSDVLSTIYPNDTAQGLSSPMNISQAWRSSCLHNVMRLSSELDRFWSNIPQHLRTSDDQPCVNQSSIRNKRLATFNLQANVLYCRFLYTRLLLLRPLLFSACAESYGNRATGLVRFNDASSLESHVFVRACALCTNTATLLIDTLHTHMHSVLRNSVWYTVYFTFSAATVLLATRICGLGSLFEDSISSFNFNVGDTSTNADGRLLSDESFQAAWAKTVAILDYHKDRIESAGRAVQVLEALSSKITAAAAAQHESTESGNAPWLRENIPRWRQEVAAQEWTAEDFSSIDLSNAWFMQQITNLDFLEL
ncbi:hypothetical protein H2198_007133 [Neophaeococcomyces mojaviensis]|uniref:Uncharacterized protein n=1 Tax=Neophaeococcomyces mojaviensis TaxID=3383035 RepID=A0ACC3A0Z9_9EURO|nr:hypothetical protein H2198_007133 [Knufia sp. JES_112]